MSETKPSNESTTLNGVTVSNPTAESASNTGSTQLNSASDPSGSTTILSSTQLTGSKTIAAVAEVSGSVATATTATTTAGVTETVNSSAAAAAGGVRGVTAAQSSSSPSRVTPVIATGTTTMAAISSPSVLRAGAGAGAAGAGVVAATANRQIGNFDTSRPDAVVQSTLASASTAAAAKLTTSDTTATFSLNSQADPSSPGSVGDKPLGSGGVKRPHPESLTGAKTTTKNPNESLWNEKKRKLTQSILGGIDLQLWRDYVISEGKNEDQIREIYEEVWLPRLQYRYAKWVHEGERYKQLNRLHSEMSGKVREYKTKLQGTNAETRKDLSKEN